MSVNSTKRYCRQSIIPGSIEIAETFNEYIYFPLLKAFDAIDHKILIEKLNMYIWGEAESCPTNRKVKTYLKGVGAISDLLVSIPF